MKLENNHIQFGEEWEEEAMKMTKKELVSMIRKIKTGSSSAALLNIIPNGTLKEFGDFATGILNNLANGNCSVSEASDELGEWTGRMMEMFWQNAKMEIKKNPELLNAVPII